MKLRILKLSFEKIYSGGSKIKIKIRKNYLFALKAFVRFLKIMVLKSLIKKCNILLNTF
jgi:hypothetical protein